MRRIGSAVLFAASLSGGAGTMLTACDGGADAMDATSGARVTLGTRVVTEPESLATFTTGFGWKVTLDAAAVSLGALYYFDGAPAFVDRARPTPKARRAWLEALFGLGVAHAHPGHYQAGDALGELRVPSSVDLFAGPARLADATGVTGDYRSAQVILGDPPQGPAAAVLAGRVAFASGVAEKADGSTKEPIHFVLGADFADVAAHATHGEVSGCDFAETKVERDGAVTLTASPRVWLDLVDFGGTAPGTASARTTIAKGTKAQIGFVLGVVQLRAYKFTYAPGGN